MRLRVLNRIGRHPGFATGDPGTLHGARRGLARVLALGAVLCGLLAARSGDSLEQGFSSPPDSARPWVYWFWLNGNITREGISADLEAMKRVGIGGVLIMEVDQGTPVGSVGFMTPAWRTMFEHGIREARRLGIRVNMNNDAGWNGSGGPWIKPEQSMQKVVWTETELQGPRRHEGRLSQPDAVAGFYRDIAVLAVPAVGSYRLDQIKTKAGFDVGAVGSVPSVELPPEMIVDRQRVVDISGRMTPDGQFVWDVPAGTWTVLRLGHTSTGVENAPSPASGRGLECDKLSQEGIEANFAGMMAKLIEDVGPGAGRDLVATHIDSWENGGQNWTARMREEFLARRGYDLLPYLPVLSGRVVGSHDVSERFLWDLRQTISDLVLENYAGHLQTLANRHGLRLSIEAYGGPCDNLPYAGRADEPMCEFWIGGGAFSTVKGMASAAHTYGKPILGAEAFTAADQEKWLEHPASIKALGDRAFCDGVNRMVFHRYALQPWMEARPGVMMGPWGLHYERTQTWWDWSGPWHAYLARCQFMLRAGLFVADLCYLQPEGAPQDFQPHGPLGYDFDHGSAEVVLRRMTTQAGRFVLPDGMSYRLLVLPDGPAMTPALLGKIRDLVRDGATVLGTPPKRSPSLSGYPQCDAEVRQLATELWGDPAVPVPTSAAPFPHRLLGKGCIAWGVTPEKLLTHLGVPPDFVSRPRLRTIHRVSGDTDIYFVANSQPHAVEALASFRVAGKAPQLWWPDSGRIEPAAEWVEQAGITRIPLRLEPAGSVFVVFRPAAKYPEPAVALTRNGQSLWPAATRVPAPVVEKAVYGVLEDPQRTRDVRADVQRILDGGEESFRVSRLAESGDPAQGIVKTALVVYTVGERRITVTAPDSEILFLPDYAPTVVVEKAVYGVLGDPRRTRDVRAKLQQFVDAGQYTFSVAQMAQGDDPAFLVVKTLVVDYLLDGQLRTLRGTDPESLSLARPPLAVPDRIAKVEVGADGRLRLQAWQPGTYQVKTASGTTGQIDVLAVPAPSKITGPWEVTFEPGRGAPEPVVFETLTDWSQHRDAGVKYFSGTATYATTFELPREFFGQDRRLWLDLGAVAIMARPKVNGKDLGILWAPPFRVEFTAAAKRGRNRLEVQVVNLWPNRLIGDEQLPEDSDRNTDGTLKSWPLWVRQEQPSLTGRLTFSSWRLWKKDGALQQSGLLGPVTVEVADRWPVAASRSVREK